MNYFDLYGLPETLAPDQGQVRKKYFQFSRQHHPDFHATASDEEQQENLRLTTLNNQAYQTLSQPDRLLEYVLGLHGLLQEGTPQELPQAFLLEMMELNEQVMELQLDPSASALSEVQQQLDALEQDLQQQASPLRERYADLPAGEQQKALQQLRELHYKQRYLLRIRQSLAKIAPPNA